MLRLAETDRLDAIFAELKELSVSEAPVVRDAVLQMLGIMRDLMAQVDPEQYYEHIVEYE